MRPDRVEGEEDSRLPDCTDDDFINETVLDGEYMDGYECVIGCANANLFAANFKMRGGA